MIVNRTGMALLLVLLTTVQVVLGQDDATIEVAVPEGIDPNERSGWIRVELAVLVDDRPEVLRSESWPPYPETRYPVSHRRLSDARQVAALAQRYPETQVFLGSDGLITLLVPDPQQVLAAATEAELRPELTLEEGDLNGDASMAITGGNGESQPPAPEPLGSDDPDTKVPALEMIDATEEVGVAGPDWLSEFTDSDPADPVASTPEANAEAETDGSAPEDNEFTPAPELSLPNAFSARDMTLLEDGLTRLTATNPDRLQLGTAWLQPPEAANLPIIFDDSGDSGEWPPLQGFVELRTGDTLRVGINFWWNTDGSYLPPGFYMEAPPAAPPQLIWRDEQTNAPLSIEEVTERQETLKAIVDHQLAGLPIVEFVDPNTGFFREQAPPQREETGLPPEDPWPWHHLLHVSDTRVVPEGYIRYFDHPVVKVITTWRELSWGEVYQLGAADRERAEIEAAVEEAQNKAASGSQPTPPNTP